MDFSRLEEGEAALQSRSTDLLHRDLAPYTDDDSITGRVREAIGLQAKAELPWDRLFVARALGGNHFTIAEEDYGGDYNYVDGEPFTARFARNLKTLQILPISEP